MWQPVSMRILPAQVELNNKIRKLLMKTNRWTRVMISRILYNINSDSQAIVQQRFNTISKELADLFTQYYGKETASQIQELFARYIQAVAAMAHDYRENDPQAATEQRAILYTVADDIAHKASSINRYWDFAIVQTILRELSNTIEDQMISMMTGDFAHDADKYDSFMDQAERLADELTYGMLKQFQM